MFVATLKLTVPSPCPVFDDVIEIHDVAVAAAHVQSRDAWTVIEPVPPDAGASGMELLAVTLHLGDVGATVLTDVDPHAVVRRAIAQANSGLRATHENTSITGSRRSDPMQQSARRERGFDRGTVVVPSVAMVVPAPGRSTCTGRHPART